MSWPELRLLAHQTAYEQKVFWRNRMAAVLSVAVPVVMIIATGVFVHGRGAAGLVALASILSFTVMSGSFNSVAMTMIVRRQLGQLKRLRGTPAPAWVITGAVLASTAMLTMGQTALLVVTGPVLGAGIPHNPLPLVALAALGAVSFGALAMALTARVSKAEVAGPVVNIGFMLLLVVSGTLFPLSPGSTMARLTSWLPVRQFRVGMGDAVSRGQLNTTACVVLAAWMVAGVTVTVRRFRWTP
jgi:ABC-2 type transport system permease protein